MTKIFVNAVAASEGGALTILKQFLSNSSDKDDYYVFVPDDRMERHFSSRNAIRFICTGKLKGFSRIFWDYFGLYFWAIKNGSMPDLVVSLQNTPVGCFGAIPQIVYLHQALPLSQHKWSLFKRSNWTFWFYKHIYPFFMRGLPNKNKYYVCQAEWMRNMYADLLHVPVTHIRAYYPNFDLRSQETHEFRSNLDQRFFIFPAQAYLYKNHGLLIEAVNLIKTHHPDLFKQLKILLTLDESSGNAICKQANKLGVLAAFDLIGSLEYSKLLSIFNAPGCALLFPSTIETIGLPLVEAASYGRSVVAPDLPYAREALAGYAGVHFLSPTDPRQWADEIVLLLSERHSFSKLNISNRPGWLEFFNFLHDVSIRH